jgi:hypothetical protein
METMLSMGFVERTVRCSVGDKPRRMTVKVAASPPRRDAAAPGVASLELVGQGEQLAFGLHCRLRAVGGPQVPLDHAAQLLGQPVSHVVDLVLLTALDDGLTEDVCDGSAQGLGAIDDDEDPFGDVKSAFAQAHQQVFCQGGVLGRALDQGERMLNARDFDAQSHHPTVLGDVHAVDHQGHQVELAQRAGQKLGQGGLGGTDEAPRDRGLARAACLPLNGATDRLQTDPIAAGGKPGEQALHGKTAEHLA